MLTEELKAIRNRIGHCRRPHADDLARLEQTLRDLNGGAFAATAAFNNQWTVRKELGDPVVDAWAKHEHPTAMRLVEHAAKNYHTIFDLQYSRRPWVKLSGQKQITGVSGCLWHAYWYFRDGGGFHLDRFWRDIEPHSDPIFLVCADSSSSLSVSFSALEKPAVIADTIGVCFDAVLHNLGHGNVPYENFPGWQAYYANIDPRVQAGTHWSMVEESMCDISMFGA